MVKKSFFKTPTAAQILKKPRIYHESNEIVDNIINLKEKEALIITRPLIPLKFQDSRKFLKHGDELRIHNYNTLEEAIICDILPSTLRGTIISKTKPRPLSGLTFRPLVGRDKLKRKFNLVDILEGTKIYCYAQDNKKGAPSINVIPYADAEGVVRDGALVVLKVPSRTAKASRYKFSFEGVPVSRNSRKHGLAYSIASNHQCEDKRYYIRYKYASDKEASRIVKFCAHDIAGYFALVDHFKSKGNKVPMHMNVFPLPTKLTVRLYDNINHNCLIQTKNDETPRKLNVGEKVILLDFALFNLGYKKTFFATSKLKNYNWKNYSSSGL